jgi:hypothetical protein
MTERERDAEVIDLDERRKKARQQALSDRLASNPRFREGPKGTGFMLVGAPRRCSGADERKIRGDDT